MRKSSIQNKSTVLPPIPWSCYSPTDAQRWVKARLVAEMRDDPLLDPKALSVDRLSRILGEPKLVDWMRDPEFRSWFLSNKHSAAKVEFLYDQWLDQVANRLSTMNDKDLINAGKLLAEIAYKMPRATKAVAIDVGLSNKSDEELAMIIKSTVVSDDKSSED